MSSFNELILRFWTRLHNGEKGQDTAEYIVMTAVVVAIVAGVIYALYSTALQTAVTSLGDAITGVFPVA